MREVKQGLYFLLHAYASLIIIDIILSWFPRLQNFAIFRLIRRTTDAYVGTFKGILCIGPIDFTPAASVFLLEALTSAYFNLIFY